MSTFYNATGTGENEPPRGFDSWVEFWTQQKGYNGCCEVGCNKTRGLVGAHVHKVGTCRRGYNQEMYILKLCDEHNQATGQLRTKSFDQDPFVRVENQECDCNN